MKILQINSNDIIGGAARVAHDLHSSLKDAGTESRMLVGRKNSDESDVESIYKNTISKAYKVLLGKLNYYTGHQFSFYPQTNILNNKLINEADILHFHNLHGSYFNLNLLPKLGARKKIIWTLHDMWAFTGHCCHAYNCNGYENSCKFCPNIKEYPSIYFDTANKLLEQKKRLYQETDITIVTPSKWLQDKTKKSILKDKDVELIHNGVNTNIFFQKNKIAIRKKLNLPLSAKLVIFVSFGGSAVSHKGKNHILTLLDKANMKNLYFLSIGGTSAVSDNKYIINVPFIKNQNTLAEYYNAADLMIYPSLADNCPLVILEAMACGTPIIAYKTGGIPELIEQDLTGRIVEQKNEQELYDTFLQLINNDNQLAKMSANSIIRIKENFTLDTMINKYIDLYIKVLNKS